MYNTVDQSNWDRFFPQSSRYIRLCGIILIASSALLATMLLLDEYIVTWITINYIDALVEYYSCFYVLGWFLPGLFIFGLLGLGHLLINPKDLYLPICSVALLTLPVKFGPLLGLEYFHAIGLTRIVLYGLSSITLTYLYIKLKQANMWKSVWRFSLLPVALYPMLVLIPLYFMGYGIYEEPWCIMWVFLGIGIYNSPHK